MTTVTSQQFNSKEIVCSCVIQDVIRQNFQQLTIAQNQKRSIIATTTQNCVINYIQLTYKKNQIAIKKTLEHWTKCKNIRSRAKTLGVAPLMIPQRIEVAELPPSFRKVACKRRSSVNIGAWLRRFDDATGVVKTDMFFEK